MAARKRKIKHDDETRAKIQASQIVNVLTNHILGIKLLETSQVTAALGLLKKVLPDLQATELKAEVKQQTIAWEPPTEDEWDEQYGDLATSARTPDSLN